MGYLLKAICTSCSFNKEVRFGSGMMDMGRTLYVPALDLTSGKMLEININDDKISLDKYQLYSEPYDYDNDDQDDKYQWGDICIRPKGHKCPKCSKKTLRFDVSAFLD